MFPYVLITLRVMNSITRSVTSTVPICRSNEKRHSQGPLFARKRATSTVPSTGRPKVCPLRQPAGPGVPGAPTHSWLTGARVSSSHLPEETLVRNRSTQIRRKRKKFQILSRLPVSVARNRSRSRDLHGFSRVIICRNPCRPMSDCRQEHVIDNMETSGFDKTWDGDRETRRTLTRSRVFPAFRAGCRA